MFHMGSFKVRIIIKRKGDELFTLDLITYIMCKTQQNNLRINNPSLSDLTILLALDNPNSLKT